MDETQRQTLEAQLWAQSLPPLAKAYQNALVAREPAERFGDLGYLHEVILKCLASQSYARVRALDLASSEMITFLRDQFRQPSTGHWAQLLACSQRLLVEAHDRHARYLDGTLRKKLRDEPVLELDQITTRLLGHTQKAKSSVSLAELMQSMIELRNKTRGHGAPRRAFYEEVNPLIETSLLVAIDVLQRFLWGSIVYVQEIASQGDHLLLQGQVLTGLMRRPWEASFAPAAWFHPQHLFLLESEEDSQALYPLDPLLVWDRRDESIGFFNGYVESKQQTEYLSYARGTPWHDRSRTYEEAFSLPAAKETRSLEMIKTVKLWSNKGVALYPVDFPLVGQNDVFNRLFKFKQAFSSNQADDITGFFALIGDWGLGKTRIGYELFAQCFNHVERWVLDQDEFIVTNDADGRLLQPALAEGILPLYVRYNMVCDDELFAGNWVARVAAAALALVAQPSTGYDVPPALLEDLRAALKARCVDLEALHAALTPDPSAEEPDDARLVAAMDVLRASGIHYLWVVVDEVETLADLKKGMREEGREAVSETYLDMLPTVIKQENHRQRHPYVNFLVLCSTGMRDKIEIGPNRRRTDSWELEPSHLEDVRTYVQYLKTRAETLGQTVEYPEGTLEGAFIASNRNFGWFNVIMSSIHESFRLAQEQHQTRTAWQLIEEFARTEARAKWVFDLDTLAHLKVSKGAPEEMVKRLVFGQLPVSLGDELGEEQAEALRQSRVPGMSGAAFVDLVEVHLDASVLADELVRPEVGFQLAAHRGGGWYMYYDNEVNPKSLLAALRAFSVGAHEGNMLVCRDLDAFTAQLSALYDRPNVNIPQIAEPVHGILLKYQVSGAQYVGPSFALLQQLDTLLKREALTIAFLQDPNKDAKLTEYADDVIKSERKRGNAICQGFARLLDDTLLKAAPSVPQIHAAASVTMASTFQSPRFEGLQVTAEGWLTIVYGRDLEKLAQELGDLIGQKGVHPIIVLLPSGLSLEDWHTLRLLPRVQLCAIARPLTRVEETFLLKYSGRGTVFAPNDILSAKTQSTRGMMVQSCQRDTESWREDVDRGGYLLRPLWYSKNVSLSDFAKGYRTMLVNQWNIDQLAPDVNPSFDPATHDRIRKACQYNVGPGPGQEPLLQVISLTEPYTPEIPPAFGALLHELRSQATVDVLARRFFFAVPDKKVKVTRQLEQVLELLRALGVVTLSGSAYRAVDAQTLKDYRQSTSAWLNGECQAMLADLSDTFTQETVGKLEKQSTSFAPKDLDAVEQASEQADLSVLDLAGSAQPEAIYSLIGQMFKIEQLLNRVCPPGVYQQTGATFECTTEQVASYEQRLAHLSLWEQVHFFYWLRDQYRQRREQEANAVRQQLEEVDSLGTVGEHPFPTAPLTLPLKAIQAELTASVASGSLSSRGALALPGYPQSINTFLYMGQYANAWHRLEALGKYIERAQPTSFWARFVAARAQWTERLRTYQSAMTAWQSLAQFVADASSPAWKGAKAIRASLDQFDALVEGGLQHVVSAEADQGAEKLIDVLEQEIKAAAKYEGLPEQIGTLRQAVESELRGILDSTRLHALSRVLTAKRRSQLIVPSMGATYAETKASYEAFNVKVVETGRRYFEDAGKATSWDRWVEIYAALSTSQYSIVPEDEAALRELEEMKLVERTVKLKS